MSSDAMRMKPWVFFMVLLIIAIFSGILGAVMSVPDPCPDSIETSCGRLSDKLCPSWGTSYSKTQMEACRREVFRECLAPRPSTMEECREQCSEIVRDLTRANDDLWERWLACTESEQ